MLYSVREGSLIKQFFRREREFGDADRGRDLEDLVENERAGEKGIEIRREAPDVIFRYEIEEEG